MNNAELLSKDTCEKKKMRDKKERKCWRKNSKLNSLNPKPLLHCLLLPNTGGWE